MARGYLPNTQSAYKTLGALINDARLAGLIDWDHLEDRTRHLRALSHWDTPADVVAAAAASYRVDRWEHQGTYVEVWIEKDALVGLIAGVCSRFDVPYFSCRGYPSQSEIWRAAQRLRHAAVHAHHQREVHVIHLGDHDPSGIDMTRDITDRLALFLTQHRSLPVTVTRIALNADQVAHYDPPPNPAKRTDSRAGGYIARHGRESWELDALSPAVIDALISTTIEGLRDPGIWAADDAREAAGRLALHDVAARFRNDTESN